MPQQILVNTSALNIPSPDGMFHASVTSPPYWGLRKYKGEQRTDWPSVEYSPIPGMEPIVIPAQRAALGLEDTPEAYVGHLVLVYREVRRVLRDDGVAWLNLGDSYGHGTSAERQQGGEKQQTNVGAHMGRHGGSAGDLLLIPHRVALALQADGWTVRNDNVWSKPNPMPESVSGWRWERCRVKVKPANMRHSGGIRGNAGGHFANSLHEYEGPQWSPCPGCDKCRDTGGYVLRRSSWRYTRSHEYIFMLSKGMGYFCNQERVREDAVGSGKRNPRGVLEVSPRPYRGAHYAVYPPDLITPLIRASVPMKCCPKCGAPWAPVVERENMVIRRPGRADETGNRTDASGTMVSPATSSTIGHRPTCDCQAAPGDPETQVAYNGGDGDSGFWAPTPVPGWCLDPFAGSGTTLVVCEDVGVNGVGIDISLEYLRSHAKKRVENAKLQPRLFYD